MSQPKTLHPELPIHVGATYAKIYGKSFDFPRYDDKARREAIEAATQHGLAIQTALKAQAGGRELTTAEQIRGRLDKPVEKSDPPRLESNPNRNPYDKLLDDLRRKVCYTDGARSQRDRRIEHYVRLQAEWNERNAVKVALDQRNADPEVQRMREVAAEHLESVRLDPTATAADVERAEKLLQLAQSDDCSPGTYWQEVKQLPPTVPTLYEGSPDGQPE